jgi:hypothetical protein
VKGTLLKALKDQYGSKKDIEKEISPTLTKNDNEFYSGSASMLYDAVESTKR